MPDRSSGLSEQVEAFLRYADAGKGPSIQMMEAAAKAIRQLRNDSYWLMETWLYEYTDLSKTDHIPDHDCDFNHRPDIGACDWHENWFGIAERNGMMEQFFREDSERAEIEAS